MNLPIRLDVLRKALLSSVLALGATAYTYAQSCAPDINTIAGNGTPGFSGDGGAATNANMTQPWGVWADATGNVYISDFGNNRIRVVDPSGNINTIAGNSLAGTGADGGPATAPYTLRSPYPVCADAAGNVYIGDYANNRVRIVNTSGTINTFAGGGGTLGDGGPATNAQLTGPQQLTVDAAGNIYIADNGHSRIRKVNTSGIITTIVGTGVSGTAPDGILATSAKMNSTLGMVVDAAGNFYFSDQGNFKIKKINTSGVLSTVAGTGVAGYTGDGGPASTAQIRSYGLAMDNSGNLYFSDFTDLVIRKIDMTTGVISTVAGTGASGYTGDGGPATACTFVSPAAMSCDPFGNLYVSDWFNNAVRKIFVNNVVPYFANGTRQTVTVCMSTTANPINTQLTVADPNMGQSINWSVVAGPFNGTASVAYSTTSTGSSLLPTGLSYTPTPGFIGTDSVKVQVTDCSGLNGYTTLVFNVTNSMSGGSIAGPTSVCQGFSIQLTDASPGGVWSTSNTRATVSSTGVVTGLSTGVVNVSYSVISPCGGGIAIRAITVMAAPTPISGTPSVCVGGVAVISDDPGGTWLSGTPSNATIGMGSGILNGISAGTTLITYTASSGCMALQTVTIYPLPVVPVASATNICGGGYYTATFSDATPGGTWSSSNTTVAVIDAYSGVASGVSGSTGGTVAISYTSSDGCSSSTPFTIDPTPSPIIGVHAMCAGMNTMTVSDADAGGSWTSTLVTVSSGGVITSHTDGVATITYTFPGSGCYTASSFIVNPLPGDIMGSKSVCTNAMITLTDTTLYGSYSSLDPTVSVDPYTGNITGISPGTAIITYSLLTGCSKYDTLNVYPAPSPIFGNFNVCVGSTTTLTDTTAGGSWSMSSGGIAMLSGVSDITGLLSGAAIVTYMTGAGCTDTAVVNVIALPTVYSMKGGGSYCVMDTGVHIMLSNSDLGTRYYLMMGSTVVDSANGNGSLLDFGLQTAAGTYTVEGRNLTTTCVNTMSGTAVVTIDPIVTPAVNIGVAPNDTVCAGTSVTYIAIPAYGGSLPVYQWKVNGANVSTSPSYVFTPVNGDVVVIELTSNATCTSTPYAVGAVVMDVVTPVIPDVTITADPGASAGKLETVTFTAVVSNVTPTTTYQWTKNTSNITGATGTTYTTASLANGDKIACKVSSGGMCSKTTTADPIIMNIYSTVGVKQVAFDGELSLYPNPNDGVFVLQGILGINTDEDITLEMTNMLGQVVFTSHATSNAGVVYAQINIDNTVSNGVYLLSARCAAGNKVFHVVIEK